MSQNYKFPSDIDRDHLSTEQPLDPMLNRSMQYPNALDPIGHIETEGRAFRNLVRGNIPRWALLLGWGSIGVLCFGVLGIAINFLTSEFQRSIDHQNFDLFIYSLLGFLPGAIVSILMMMILWRATFGKR